MWSDGLSVAVAAKIGGGGRGGLLEYRVVYELRDDPEAPGLQKNAVSSVDTSNVT